MNTTSIIDTISVTRQDTLFRAVTEQIVSSDTSSNTSLVQAVLDAFIFMLDNPLLTSVLFLFLISLAYLLMYRVVKERTWSQFGYLLRELKCKLTGKEIRREYIEKVELPIQRRADDSFPEVHKLFGREERLKQLKELLTSRKPPVVQLVGMSGVGKTMLAAKAVDELSLDYVRLELHGESTEKVAEQLFEIFTQLPAPQKRHADIVALAMEGWHQRGCLLVIDNLHVLLDDRANPKDDMAKLLLAKLSEAAGGQLLTLSWLRTDALGTGKDRVLVWELEGLKEKPGIEKLRAEGVRGEPKITLEKVVDNLKGNPKMLEILGLLLAPHKGDASILDERPDWIESSMAPLRAMWEAIGKELQKLLAALCVFRRGRNAERLGRFLEAKNIQQQLDALIKWGLAKSLDGVRDYAPDHDLVRKIVKEKFSEEKLRELHKRAASLWLEEGKDIGKEKMPTTIAEIQPLLEAGVHLAEAKEGTRLLNEVIARQCGDAEFHNIADRVGAWVDLTSLFEQLIALETDASLLAKHRHNLGMRYQARGDWDAALREYWDSLKIKEKVGDQQGIARTRHQIGRVYQDKSDLDAALKEYKANLKTFGDLGDLRNLAATHHQIGMVYQDKGDWDAALQEYKANLETFKELGDLPKLAATRHQIGMAYHDKGDWDAALQEYRASLEIAEKLGDQRGISRSRHEIGRLYQKKGDLDVALIEYKASLKIEEKIGDKQGVAESNGQLGLLFTQMKQFDKALYHTLIALQLFGELGDPRAPQAFALLVRLRQAWGGENFDKAWREKIGEEVPEELKKASEKAK